MKAHEEQVKKLIAGIFAAHDDGGIDCDTCSAQFACLVELVADGAEMSALMPAVEQHLRCCACCREEFEALSAIIRAEQRGLTQN